MNKKNITLILVGIMLLSVQFIITIGSVKIDIFSDIIAFVLILIGGLPLCNRNKVFKKMRFIMFLGLGLTIAGQALNCLTLVNPQASTGSAAIGLSIVASIYFTYYFTEGLILESVFQEKSACTRSFRLTWMLLSALLFATFFLSSSEYTIFYIIIQVVLIIYTLFYCSTVLTACQQLYMDGIPTKRMDI